ncbi:MAG: APC family permease, partial [Candidatus Heimdallarchaeaceae archaeon]
ALGIAVGALIGGGVFSVLGLVIIKSGPAAFLAFILAGVVSSFTAYSYVFLALKYPKAGGAFIYAKEAFKSKLLSGSLGIILWFGYSFSVSLYALTFGRYFAEVFNFGQEPIIEKTILFPAFLNTSVLAFVFQILSVSLFIGINMLGVKESAKMQNFLVLLKVTILVVYVVMGLTVVKKESFTPFFSDNGFFGVLISSVLIFVAMEGFEILSNSVEEMKNPERDLPIGMFLSILIVLIIYVSVAIVTVGVLGMGNISEEMGEVILTVSAEKFLNGAGIFLMAGAAIISSASAINATLLGSSRLSYMLSHENIIPKAIAKINPKTRVPMKAIAISGIMSIVFVILFNIETVATAASIIFMLIFAVVNLSAVKLLQGKKRIVSAIGVVFILIYWGFWIKNMVSGL